VGRRRVRELLACGLAGQPVTTAGSLLYDARRVEALGTWPMVTLDDLDDICPGGIFIARRRVPWSPQSSPQPSPPPSDIARAWGGDWPLSYLTPLWLRLQIERHGPFPFLGVVCGFITFGASITAVDISAVGISAVKSAGSDSYDLALAPAGTWFDTLRQHRLDAPGGKTFMVRGWPSRT